MFLSGSVDAQDAKVAIQPISTSSQPQLKDGPGVDPCSLVPGFSVNLIRQNFRANDCGPRIITASVCNGVGPFKYSWSANPSSNVTLGNTASISVSPQVPTEFEVTVRDEGTNPYQFAIARVLVTPIITGAISAWATNVLTPNGDGINDTWQIRDNTPNRGTGPLNAYGYRLRIFDRWGVKKLERSYTDTRINSVGLIGGQIQWDGRDDNGVGCVDGDYYYRVDFYNCSLGCSCSQTHTDFIQGWVSIFASNYMRAASNEPTPFTSTELGVYPNPANEKVVVNPYMVAGLDAADNRATAPRHSVLYKVELLDKTGLVRYSGSATKQAVEIDTKSLANGIYFLRIIGDKGDAITKQIVVDHSR
ncbi:hypothetical protein GCM10023185_40220 [Hymenobacter saemangeumensis]|uniref:Secretion system C-terminal sorting domain-containing protein n=2 Tax=Hymenobacter saemangeumensis TaxID=1084522 RepID=A0ABP8IQZ5_9BACT